MRTGSAAWRGRTADPYPDLRLGWRVLAAVTITVLAVVYVAHAALPVTSFSLPFSRQGNYVRVLAPQGWAFFTRNPRLPRPVVLGRGADGAWRPLSPGPIAVPADLMGLNRVRQSQDLELQALMSDVPSNGWSACDRRPTDCLSGLSAGRVLVNSSAHREVCGDVGLIFQEVQPWAWRDLPTTMPSRVARVTVTC